MKIKKQLIPVILIFLLTTGLKAQNWKEQNYAEYTYKSFKNYAAANQIVDFNAIDYKLLDAAIFYATNEERAKHNKTRFLHSAALEKAALQHSTDMVELNFFSHTGKVKSRRKLDQRVRYGGIEKYYAAGENIAMTSSTYAHTYIGIAKDLLTIWMNSPGHRANILDASFKYVGCAAYFNKDNEVYATQIFTDMNASTDYKYSLPSMN